MKKSLKALVLTAIFSLSMTMVSLADQSPELNQSPRWYSENGTWYLRNEAGTGNVVNSWFQDLDGSWYLLAPDGHMYAGLIHDTITNRWYYCQTEHNGYFGKMAFTDGLYTVNNKQVYLTFNQIHDGTFGCITSGLESLQGAGIETTDIAGIPTESERANTSGAVSSGSTVGNSGTSGNGNGATTQIGDYTVYTGGVAVQNDNDRQYDVNGDGILDVNEQVNKQWAEDVLSGKIDVGGG